MNNQNETSFSYKEAMDYISQTSQYGSVLGLENTRELLSRLGNPQDKLKFIHVGGTNGKGSVSAFIGTILAVSGYLVGKYVSPTILEYRERIQLCYNKKNEDEYPIVINAGESQPLNRECISSNYISEEEVGRYLSSIKSVIDGMLLEGLSHPTPFEIETAMAFLYFLDMKCDIVVLEVGLGGRFDSTNVILTTVCAVLTSISMDHMQILGDTLQQISYEKAGIIKKNTPVVSYEQAHEAMKVINEVCKEEQAKLTCMELQKIRNVNHSFQGIIFDYKGYKKLKVNLLGENQVKNASLAVEVVGVLLNLGFAIGEEDIREGLELTKWPGRFEMIQEVPAFFVDGGHNEEAAKSLSKSIEIYFRNRRRIIYIIGVLADKDYHNILKYTARYADTIITITPDNSRALSSKELSKVAMHYCKNVIDGETINHAIDIAMELADKQDVILAFGSLSYLGEIYAYFDKNN